jgi:hypothetical protein
MRVLRAAGGSLLLVLTLVVGLLGALLSITIILLPVGIPLLFLARKLFAYSMTLFLPRAVRHPVQELGKQSRRRATDAADSVGFFGKSGKRARRRGRKLAGKARKQVVQKVGRKDRSLMGRFKRAV